MHMKKDRQKKSVKAEILASPLFKKSGPHKDKKRESRQIRNYSKLYLILDDVS